MASPPSSPIYTSSPSTSPSSAFCEASRKIKSRNKRRKVTTGSSDCSSENDGEFSRKYLTQLSKDVSYWNIETAEGLGIFYNDKFLPNPFGLMSIIEKNTGTCAQISRGSTLDKLSNLLKNYINFEDIGDDCKKFMDRVYLQRISSSLARVKHEIFQHLEDSTFLGREACVMNNAVEFIEQIAYMLSRELQQHQGTLNVSTAVYRNVVMLFARMCLLFPRTGDEYKSKKTINGEEIISVPGIRLQKYLDDALDINHCGTTAVVTVIEGKHPQEYEKDDIFIKNTREGADEKPDKIKPAILNFLGTKGSAILGQHAGELLLDYDLSPIPYMPGMIVTGSKIFFTLLEMNVTHIQKLKQNQKLNALKDKATIYYSAPLDVLIKKERDILIEAFMRLNNI